MAGALCRELVCGINAECLFRAPICRRAGQQASRKAATPAFCTEVRPRGRTGGGPLRAGLWGAGPWGARGHHSLSAGVWESAKGKTRTLASPSPSPTLRPPPPRESPAVRILIPEYLAPPSMATVPHPPCTASTSFLPVSSPCSPLLSPEPGLLGGGTPPQSIHPLRRGRQAFPQADSKPHQSQSPRMAKPWGTTFKDPGKLWLDCKLEETKEREYSLLSPHGREKPVI